MLSNPLGLQKCTFLHKTGIGNRCKCVSRSNHILENIFDNCFIDWPQHCQQIMFITIFLYLFNLRPNRTWWLFYFGSRRNYGIFQFLRCFFYGWKAHKKGKIPVVLPQCLMWLFIKNFDLKNLLKAQVFITCSFAFPERTHTICCFFFK